MEILDILSSLVALIMLEVVLGVDNLVFISIVTEKLPPEERRKARKWGLTFAWVTRLGLLASAVLLIKLTRPLIQFYDFSFSIRDLFLLIGGAFLIMKATQEIHHEVAHDLSDVIKQPKTLKKNTMLVVLNIAIMDIIFSLDSVLTAVALTQHFWIMAIAITIAILVMLYASEPVSRFIDKYPTIKMLALSFLILIGTFLMADGFSFHVPRGYLYFAMGFAIGVELLNIIKRNRVRGKR